jgi:hypothetical protein
MNERIRELAEQAREFATTRHPVSNIVLSVNSEKFEEKFAELIVRECAQVCNNIDVEYEGEDVLATWCASAIKEHFGVEE